MPQPYNYNVELFNPMNAFAGYNQGRNDLRAEQQQKKSDAFAQYLPGALEGDKAALEQANANASPEQIMQLHSVLKQKSKEELAQIMQQNDIVGGLLSGVKDDASLANAKRIAVEQFGMPQERVAAITLQDVPALVEQSQSAREAIEAHLKTAEYQDRHRMANANVAQSYAAADASRANAEFTREGKVTTTGKLTEGQSKDLSFYRRGTAANNLLQAPLIRKMISGWNATVSGVPFYGNALLDKEARRGMQASRDFIAAILRKDTGAAVTPQEFDFYSKIFIPEYGDDDETLAQKAESRKQTLESIRAGLGSAQPLTEGGPQPIEAIAPQPRTQPGLKIERIK